MNWSNAVLKLTIGVGSMGATAILSDPLVEWVGLYAMIAIILVPFFLLVFFKIGELADWIIKLAHLIAVFWYIALVSYAVYLMQARGFQTSDAMIGAFMAIGFAPVIMVIWNIYKGKYNSVYHV
jgi:hypothetical protein